MNNKWKKLGLAVLSSAILMAASCSAGDLEVSGQGMDEALNKYDGSYDDLLGEIGSLFDGLGMEDFDSVSQTDSYTSEGDLIALDDLGISINAKDYYLIEQDTDGFVYVFTMGEYIPFVMITYLDTDWDVLPDGFEDMITELMQNSDPNVRVADEAYKVTISGREFLRIRYEYTIQGYTASDTRLFCQWNNRTYMFASKEIYSRGDVLPDNYLAQIAGSMAPLAGGDSDYPKHVDSTRKVSGPGPSVGQIGGFGGSTGSGGDNTPQGGTDTPQSSGGPTSVGGPVGSGGPVGRDQQEGGVVGSVTFDESLADYEGVWVEFTDGFKLYLPVTWNTYNLTQDQYNAGMFYMAGDTSGSAAPAGIGVSYGEKGELTLEEIVEMFRQDGCDVDGIIDVNGILCVSYASEEEDCCGVVFFHPEGLDYFFMVQAFQYSSNVDTLAAVLCSLTPTV